METTRYGNYCSVCLKSRHKCDCGPDFSNVKTLRPDRVDIFLQEASKEDIEKLKKILIENYKKGNNGKRKNCLGSIESNIEKIFEGLCHTK